MRLIDVDVLEMDADYDDGEYWAYSKTQIDNAPTIEPQRPKGKWIPVDDREIPYGLLFKCSQCGTEVIVNDALEHNFCSECGCQMER